MKTLRSLLQLELELGQEQYQQWWRPPEQELVLQWWRWSRGHRTRRMRWQQVPVLLWRRQEQVQVHQRQWCQGRQMRRGSPQELEPQQQGPELSLCRRRREEQMKMLELERQRLLLPPEQAQVQQYHQIQRKHSQKVQERLSLWLAPELEPQTQMWMQERLPERPSYRTQK